MTVYLSIVPPHLGLNPPHTASRADVGREKGNDWFGSQG